jgi:hypothetical protein
MGSIPMVSAVDPPKIASTCSANRRSNGFLPSTNLRGAYPRTPGDSKPMTARSPYDVVRWNAASRLVLARFRDAAYSFRFSVTSCWAGAFGASTFPDGLGGRTLGVMCGRPCLQTPRPKPDDPRTGEPASPRNRCSITSNGASRGSRRSGYPSRPQSLARSRKPSSAEKSPPRGFSRRSRAPGFRPGPERRSLVLRIASYPSPRTSMPQNIESSMPSLPRAHIGKSIGGCLRLPTCFRSSSVPLVPVGQRQKRYPFVHRNRDD